MASLKNDNLNVKKNNSELKDDNNLEYESEPEESKRLLTSRRRLASDDEEESEAQKPTAVIQSDEESDGQGAPEEYKDDESDYYSEEEYQEVVEGDDVVENEGLRSIGDGNEGPRLNEEVDEGVKEKKENEPFSVPTAGAFYMHDVRDNARGGRARRMLGGRQLWELQDNKKWGHDKFEEMSTQERHLDEGRRNCRGRYRGRGKNRGGDHRNSGGNKSKVQDTYNQRDKDEAPPKITKGRGFRKYDSAKRNKDEAPPIQYRQRSLRTSENLHAVSRKAPAPSSDLESSPVSSSKQVFASSLNVASPPFYPSISSNKETTTPIQKRDVQTGNANRGPRSASIDDTMYMSERIAVTKSRNGVDSVGMDRLHINDSVSSNDAKLSFGSSMVGAHPRAQGRDVASSGFQPGAPRNQVIRASMPSQFSTMQRNPIESGGRSLDSNKFQSALVAKEKGSVRGGGQGSFMYGGSQVVGVSGNLSSGHADQNFAGTPTFLPVMHFGGQHPGGMGVPTVGMAIPGYVAQPNGSGKSEMTWLPVLAGAAGALGSAYGSSCISLESAYHSRPTGQSSSSGASSNDSNTNMSTSEWKPAQTPEVASDEVGQRQRYTEMNFGQ